MSGLIYPKFFPILNDKVVIVTGAAMGMGEATAKLFAAAGAKVLCADHNEEEGRRTVDEIVKAGGTATFQFTEIANSSDVQAMVKAAVDIYGHLDGAVNNAAHIQDDKRAWDFDEDYWDELEAVNIKGTAMCMKYEIQQMIKQGNGGSIVNVSSINSVRPKDFSVAYTSSKHAVMGMTKVASMEAGQYNIRVSCLAPGGINTPMLRDAVVKVGKKVTELGGMSRLGRIGEPEEIAMGNLFLISDMSTYVTGTTLFVDGGHSVL
ncbi:SDR family NAD(P)-dependent oxidoreductase [Clostridium drakei]|uniref:Glucose dehydrogenase n=1 Tax=Clostridium drakei TaxID=332101 RepID=A0A2U8DMG0_9CLOT|nr:SDR family oxidoreductase [Clostridium drakei]AWI03601.1 glucose dehydrogenase [Clostridium drakei]